MAVDFQGTADAGQQAITGAATGGRIITGQELRDASVPSSFVNNGNTNAGAGQANEIYNPVNLTINLNGGVAPKSATFTANGISSDGKTHTAILTYNGVPVQTFTIPAGSPGSGAAQSVSYTTPFANTGDTYSWSFDGLPGASGVINVDGGNFNETPAAFFSFKGSGAPTSTPAPTPGPTNNGVTTGSAGNNNAPSPTPPPAGGVTGATADTTNPPSTVNNNNTTISGTSNGATNEDIYADVYRALMDAGAATSGVSMTAFAAMPTYTPPASTDGVPTGDDLATMFNSVKDSMQNARDTLDSEKDNADSLKASAQALIPSFGTVPGQVMHLTFPVPQQLFGVSSFVLDGTPYADVVANFRLVCSVSLAVLLFMAFVSYCRGALADLRK